MAFIKATGVTTPGLPLRPKHRTPVLATILRVWAVFSFLGAPLLVLMLPRQTSVLLTGSVFGAAIGNGLFVLYLAEMLTLTSKQTALLETIAEDRAQ